MAVIEKIFHVFFFLLISSCINADYLKTYRFDFTSQNLTYSYDATITQELSNHLLRNCPNRINEIIVTLKNSEKFENCLPSKILLTGLPGVGKTTLAFAIACHTGRSCLFISASTVANEYKNSGAQNLQKQIDIAIALNEPMIIIIDEITSLTDHYKESNNLDSNMTEALWLALDQCAHSNNIFIIATANDTSKMPEQLKSRFEGQVIEISSEKDSETKLNAFKFHLNNFYHGCDDVWIDSFIKRIKRFAPRQIEELIKQAAVYAKLDNLDAPYRICPIHLSTVLNNFYESEKYFNKKSFDWDKWGSRLSTWSSVVVTGVNVALMTYCLALVNILNLSNLTKDESW